MNELTLSAILDSFLGFSEIFEFDTKLLQQQRQQIKIEKDIKREIPYPKAKFFDFITRELDRQIESKCGPLKNLQKSNSQQQQAIDAILYKLKLIDQTLTNQQNIINEKPSTKDFYEVNQCSLTTQRQLNLFMEKVENQNEYFRSEIMQKLNDIVYREEYDEGLLSFQQAFQSKIEKKYVEKVMYEGQQQDLLMKIKQQQILMQENTQELRKDIYGLNEEIKLLQDSQLKKVPLSDFVSFKQKILGEFATKIEIHSYMDMIDPKLNQIIRCNTQTIILEIGEFQKRIDEFYKFLKQTDYQLLSKASKMDHELLKKDLTSVQIQQNTLAQSFKENFDKSDEFKMLLEQRAQELTIFIKNETKIEIIGVLHDEIENYLKKFDLNEIEGKFHKLKQSISTKANKLEVIDNLKLKQNKAEAQHAEFQINTIMATQTSIIKVVVDFMDLFSESQDLESFNFKKSVISKLIHDASQLIQQKEKTSVENMRNRSESLRDEFHETGPQKPIKQLQSPRLTAYKPLLRPLLTTTFNFAQKKSNKLNSSNS